MFKTALVRQSKESTRQLKHYPFDAVYCINLDRRRDRWQHVQRQLRVAQLPLSQVERVSGVDGTTLDLDALHKQGILTDMAMERLKSVPTEQKLFGMDLTMGAVGCALSHRNVWQTICERRNECALILEDDVEFHPSISKTFSKRWSKVPSNWGVVYFGGLDLLSSGKPPRPYIDEGIRYAFQGHRELTAYVVNRQSAERCLQLSQSMTWQIDTHICCNFTRDETADDDYISDPLSLVFQPSLAIQIAKFGTDVQKSHEINPSITDASRRMREFVGGGTSVR